jgi:hypothetical protein
MSDTMKIAGDTFTITSNGECAAGPWKIADASNQLVGAVPQTIRENREETEKRIKEVMDNNYEDYQWGMFYSKNNREYCVVLRGDKEINFGKILSTM